MKKKLLVALSIMMLIGTGEIFAETLTLKNGNTPVQIDKFNSRVIDLLDAEMTIEKLSSSDGMYKVTYKAGDDTVTGWINSSNVKGNSSNNTGVLNSYGRIYDYVVKTDAEGALPVISDWQTLQKILSTYPTKNKVGPTGTYKLHKESVCKALIEAQEKYKINALYLASSAIWTCGGGRSMKYKNNILNIGTGTYSSVESCILAGGSLLERSYFPEGRITVKTIRQKWNYSAGLKRAIEIARQIVIFTERAIEEEYVTDQAFIDKFNKIWERTRNKDMYL